MAERPQSIAPSEGANSPAAFYSPFKGELPYTARYSCATNFAIDTGSCVEKKRVLILAMAWALCALLNVATKKIVLQFTDDFR